MDHDLQLLLALNRLPGHDVNLKRRLLDTCRDEADLESLVALYAELRSPRSRAPIPQVSGLLKDAEGDLKRMKVYGISSRILGESDYPAPLSQISDPPFVLFHRGNVDGSRKPSVAVVGTRRPSVTALQQAFRIGLEFSLAGYPVVSGLAFGIDKAAHEGSLAGGGPTIAVLAGGLDRPGPRAHRKLAGRILDTGGALVGEIPPGEYPQKYAFPRRNRILSGLCRGCLVVQAPEKSGALITADFALDQGRDLYVASCGLSGLVSEGSRSLEAQGAPIVEGAADILGDWGRFLDIRTVRALTAPEGAEDLVRMMKSELQGRLHRFMGGWFEYRSA